MRSLAASLASLVRQDAAFVDRLKREDRLGGVVLACLVAIVLGAGAYGVAFGLWRAPESALYAALKLPLVLLGVSAVTSIASAMLAPALRARITFAQTFTCILVSFAVTSTLLGAAAPIAIFFVESAPPIDPRALGLAASHPLARPSIATAQALVLMHTSVIAVAGIAGVVRLLGLLSRLGDPPLVVRRVLVSWIAMQFLVGAELSWILRPFLGRPHVPTCLLTREAFDGSFFEEIALLGRATFGGAAPLVGLAFVLGVAAWLVVSLRTVPTDARVSVGPGGLAILGPTPRTLPWSAVGRASVDGRVARIHLVPDETLSEDVLTVTCATAREASTLATTIEHERRRARSGPFRTAPT